MAERLGLAEVVASLRSELIEAVVAGDGSPLRFQLGPIDVELQVQIEKTGGASGKVRFWVIEAGGEGSVTSTSSQVIKLQLAPVDARTQKQVLVADDGG